MGIQIQRARLGHTVTIDDDVQAPVLHYRYHGSGTSSTGTEYCKKKSNKIVKILHNAKDSKSEARRRIGIYASRGKTQDSREIVTL
jgi:hypothetical protein